MAKKKEKPISKKRLFLRIGIIILCIVVLTLGVLLYAYSGRIVKEIGSFLVQTHTPVQSDAVVVLYTEGVEYYPRLLEAATLFGEGFAKQVVINGNRKSESLKQIEKAGYSPCCLWFEDAVRILNIMGVSKDRIMAISAEEVYDTFSEAEAVGEVLAEAGVSSMIIVTSKAHTRRAYHIWKKTYPDRFDIRIVGAHNDSYKPDAWWKDGRQIRWTLWEYGAWVFYLWRTSGHLEK
jgi:uncharacterized SAM-binding protein YcdF (DUF218 family)